MSVNFEIKGMLAKLLATEDIIVEHKKVATACFNVHTRVLTLPLWEKASNNVYDLLVSHECGHSIFTPDCDWNIDRKIPVQYVNVVEDARIEKLMKRKYAGLAKTFYNGYNELNDDDFFSLENEEIPSFNLADRANLFFKVGNFHSIFFTEEEYVIIDLIASTETFADTLNAAEALYNYCKEKNKKIRTPNIDNLETNNEIGGSGNMPMENSLPDEEIVENKQQETTEPSLESEGSSSMSSSLKELDDILDVKTDTSLSERIQELNGNASGESVYLEVPSVNLSTIVVSNKNVHKCCDHYYATLPEYYANIDFNSVPDSEFNSFKISAQKEVNYLVKEFECKKSASQYARSSISRTGILDTTKLHTYKFNEDLFKKVNVIPDGKNHGLIFVCDWSGSMGPVMLDTIKQMFQLVWFCKKVQIPFDVYAFTTEWWNMPHINDNGTISFPTDHYEKRENLFSVHPNFNMLNILTSGISNRELDRQMKNIWKVGIRYSKSTDVPIPPILELSGTPLNEAIISLFEIIPDFKKRTRAEKVNVVILTDGESNNAYRHREVTRTFEDESKSFIGIGNVPYGSYLRDRKTGNTYHISKSNSHETVAVTVTLLRNLSDRFDQENIIGFRVCGNRDFGTHLRRYIGYNNSNLEQVLMKQWKKDKAVSLPNSGYKKYFTLSASSLSQDSEFKVDDDASKSQIKNAFKKSLGAKKTNKKILSQFIELVA